MGNAVKVVLAVLVLGAIGVTVWFFAVSGAEPSTDVTAPPLETTTPGETKAPGETTTTADAAVTTDGGETTTTLAAGSGSVFELTDESTATFVIREELRGSPNDVTGVSSIVLGQLAVDPADLSQTEIGTILVNARDFATDSGLRDRAINGPILDAGAFEFIEFAPTAIEGLSGAGEVGQSHDFTVTGDLTIRDVTHEATFDVTATMVSEDRIEGTATGTVLRSDFDIQIPNVASVANVSDEVELTLDFVAAPTA